MSNNIVRGFFAYPSDPPSIAEYVHAAIDKINRSKSAFLKPWDQCRVGGKIVIQEICKEISSSDLFCADMTGMNANVMFELGYAIAKDKRVWLTIDNTRKHAKKEFEQLRILTTVGYADCCNSDQIVSRFYHDAPYSDIESTIFAQFVESQVSTDLRESLLYLRSRHETEASIRVSKALNDEPVPIITDDPKESALQSLTWYGGKVFAALGVVCHLTSPEREGARLDNARHALVAGMAFGIDKPLLMLAEGDFLSPIDYREIVRHYDTPSQAKTFLVDWITPVSSAWRDSQAEQQDHAATVRLATHLRGIRIGEHIAEHEADELVHRYFVETSAYREALQGRHILFVGRKGTGKTANLLKIADDLTRDKRNLVCVVKPVGYDLEGIVELMKRYQQRDTKGHAVESLWKYLLYTEIAKTVVEAIASRPPGNVMSVEAPLVALVEENQALFDDEFSTRLERVVTVLLRNTSSDDSRERIREAISESLHRKVIGKIRDALKPVLAERERVAVLVDNLDKAWDKRADLPLLAEFLLGLVSAGSRLSQELRQGGPHHTPVDFGLLVFLRSDIFDYVAAVAREPDKISYSRIKWSDTDLLLRIIEERFVASHQGDARPQDLWKKYFCASIRQAPTRAYMASRVLPRPRDLLFFVNAAIAVAVNRGHALVTEQDILDAEKQYSQYALETILVENGVVTGNLEDILYEFAGSASVMSREEVVSCLQRVKVPSQLEDAVIEHLCGLTFLGLRVGDEDFRFADDAGEHRRNAVLATRHAEIRNESLCYAVHKAFHAFLELVEDEQ